ncbi:unnamed protein product [Parascedosporium putredinis]|uniref:Uncharacterized protein n=1 Tax=Parascedosporium putredinis TaxID=1442378 RepID=A0A9P1MFW9_9PEZI|nr:unnamed protein product [Parascedosporium putredinis]CAI8003256.1 unnamed protein product [Parascedosporium putredinis]
MDDFATQAAEIIQVAHINRNPDPRRDINPSTAASKREPVSLVIDSDDDDEDSPYVVRKPPSSSPIPDLRFEQSYLRSISKAQTWWEVAFITVKDQVRFATPPSGRPREGLTIRTLFDYPRKPSSILVDRLLS